MYEEIVDIGGRSILAGNLDGGTMTMSELRESGGILAAFAADIDIQRIEVVSTNIGFVRWFQKRGVKCSATTRSPCQKWSWLSEDDD